MYIEFTDAISLLLICWLHVAADKLVKSYAIKPQLE